VTEFEILAMRIDLLERKLDVFINPAEQIYKNNAKNIDQIKEDIRICKKRNYDLTIMVEKLDDRVLAVLEKLTKKICKEL